MRGSIVSMTGGGESFPNGARDSDPMKPQLESPEPEDTSELTGAGLTPVVVAHVLNFTTRHRFELINLTQQVEELVGKTGIRGGVALLQSLHSTAALFVNEWQEALLEDFRTLLEQAVRADATWRHNDPRYSDCDRSNAASHLRALLLGSSADAGGSPRSASPRHMAEYHPRRVGRSAHAFGLAPDSRRLTGSMPWDKFEPSWA